MTLVLPIYFIDCLFQMISFSSQVLFKIKFMFECNLLSSITRKQDKMSCTMCPKSLRHFLKPHISKTTMHDGKFETYLEGKKIRKIILTPNSTPFTTHLYIYTSKIIQPHNTHNNASLTSWNPGKQSYHNCFSTVCSLCQSCLTLFY